MLTAMAEGQRLSLAQLPAALQGVLRQALFLGWGSGVISGIEHAPLYLLRVQESSLEFGLMPRDFPDASLAGKVYGPPPYFNFFWSTLDCEP